MAKEIDKDKKLNENNLDDVTYSKKEVRKAWIKLVFGLWGVFIISLIIFFLCTRHIIG